MLTLINKIINLNFKDIVAQQSIGTMFTGAKGQSTEKAHAPSVHFSSATSQASKPYILMIKS